MNDQTMPRPGSGAATLTMCRENADLWGFCQGARILTLDGEMPVEYLTPGDRVITRDTGMALLRRMTRREVEADAIMIHGGALGQSRPDRDLILPADQPVLIRDWRAKTLFGTAQALVPVSALVDGEFIRPAPRRRFTLFELRFDAPHILYVDGLELASSSASPLARAA